ncbi:MAG: PH domain-containing protein [Acholeplasmataceae bacterium]|nr:PH domain-containing protein [Acholeplasmataceae bacterium]
MQNQEQEIMTVKVSKWSLIGFIFSFRTLLILIVAGGFYYYYMRFTDERALYAVYLTGAAYLMMIFRKYYTISTKYYVLTNLRLSEKRRHRKDTRYVPLKQIATVNSRSAGLAGRIFNYGHITITTTGNTEFKDIEYLCHPHEVGEKLIELIS